MFSCMTTNPNKHPSSSMVLAITGLADCSQILLRHPLYVSDIPVYCLTIQSHPWAVINLRINDVAGLFCTARRSFLCLKTADHALSRRVSYGEADSRKVQKIQDCATLAISSFGFLLNISNLARAR